MGREGGSDVHWNRVRFSGFGATFGTNILCSRQTRPAHLATQLRSRTRRRKAPAPERHRRCAPATRWPASGGDTTSPADPRPAGQAPNEPPVRRSFGGMGPWHRTISGFSGGALITAASTHWGDEASPWIALGAAVLLVATLAHGWAWPRLRQWRAKRREPGYLKIVGGFRTANLLVIKYANGRQDATVFAPSAHVTAWAGGAKVVVDHPSRRKQYREWWSQRPGQT
jgi:hypothetical protein